MIDFAVPKTPFQSIALRAAAKPLPIKVIKELMTFITPSKTPLVVPPKALVNASPILPTASLKLLHLV